MTDTEPTRCPVCRAPHFGSTDPLLCRIGDLIETRADEPLFHIATTLNRIADLLQQLVDKGQQGKPAVPAVAHFTCRDCQFVCSAVADWQAHHGATQHALGLVDFRAQR